ncbi:MAG: hypothetical protein MJZ23_03270 [Paludibacteraceae bacterium]|nr:hypothetical protein [Paludibacteraceae bacterium]
MSLKKLMLSSSLFLGLFLCACSGVTQSPEYKELKKSGLVHDAVIMEVDSVKGECTYEFSVNEKVYHGKCKQVTEAGDSLRFKQFILVVYLDRDPNINRRLKE